MVSKPWKKRNWSYESNMSLKGSGLETVGIYKKTDILESLILKGIKIKLDDIF